MPDLDVDAAIARLDTTKTIDTMSGAIFRVYAKTNGLAARLDEVEAPIDRFRQLDELVARIAARVRKLETCRRSPPIGHRPRVGSSLCQSPNVTAAVRQARGTRKLWPSSLQPPMDTPSRRGKTPACTQL
jgi:hypothetical protein